MPQAQTAEAEAAHTVGEAGLQQPTRYALSGVAGLSTVHFLL
jgi:hypothetical protein